VQALDELPAVREVLVGRQLQSLVLARGGVLDPVFISIEEYLGRNTRQYYDVLAEVGSGSWQPGNDTRPWVRFIITAHLRQTRTTLTRIRESERLWIDLEALARRHCFPVRVLPLLFDAAMGFRVRNATYRATLEQTGDEQISEPTASRDLQRLVEAALLTPKGEKRGRYYVAAPAVRHARQAIIDSRNPRDDSDPFG